MVLISWMCYPHHKCLIGMARYEIAWHINDYSAWLPKKYGAGEWNDIRYKRLILSLSQQRYTTLNSTSPNFIVFTSEMDGNK